MGTSRNRTYWPTTGGAVSFQPGWFRGHLQAQLQINLGYGTDGPDGGPPNMSNIMVKPFMLLGPTNNPYPGTVCLPQVPLPAGANVSAGDRATIQVVEQAQHGASLYSVSYSLMDETMYLITEANRSRNQTVRRHHLCRARRPPHPHRQRDKLLQLDAIRLRPNLHRHHAGTLPRRHRLHDDRVGPEILQLGRLAAARCRSDMDGFVMEESGDTVTSPF